MPSATSRSQFRIVIIEDHVLFAESLELALTVEGYDVRRVAVPEKRQSPGALIAAVLRRRPRVVFVDLDLGQFGEGEQLIAPLARAGVNVIVVTASVDRARWGEAVRCGARKVLPKSRPLNEILATVRRINQGLQVMTLEEREELLREWAKVRAANVDLNAASRDADRPRARGPRPPDEGPDRPGDRHRVRGGRGDGAHPGEVHPGQARGHLAAGGRRAWPTGSAGSLHS